MIQNSQEMYNMAKVPPKKEVCICGVWYRAGDELPEDKKAKKPKTINKESADGDKPTN